MTQDSFKSVWGPRLLPVQDPVLQAQGCFASSGPDSVKVERLHDTPKCESLD